MYGYTLPPDLSQGARVAIWTRVSVRYATVERTTATQVIVTLGGDATFRYRKSDGRLIGSDGLRSGGPLLLAVDAPEVMAVERDAAIQRAMAPLINLHHEVTVQSRINTRDYAQALSIAERMAETAGQAVTALRALEEDK